MSERPTVVLVHGARADGSSWSAVIESLQAAGFIVTAPQFPETSLADGLARSVGASADRSSWPVTRTAVRS